MSVILSNKIRYLTVVYVFHSRMELRYEGIHQEKHWSQKSVTFSLKLNPVTYEGYCTMLCHQMKTCIQFQTRSKSASNVSLLSSVLLKQTKIANLYRYFCVKTSDTSHELHSLSKRLLVNGTVTFIHCVRSCSQWNGMD